MVFELHSTGKLTFRWEPEDCRITLRSQGQIATACHSRTLRPWPTGWQVAPRHLCQFGATTYERGLHVPLLAWHSLPFGPGDTDGLLKPNADRSGAADPTGEPRALFTCAGRVWLASVPLWKRHLHSAHGAGLNLTLGYGHRPRSACKGRPRSRRHGQPPVQCY